jgi:hypothetical protein
MIEINNVNNVVWHHATARGGKVMGKILRIRSLIVLSCLLLAVPFSAYAADMLIVKDTGGVNTKFVVTSEGKVGIGIANPGLMFDALGDHVPGTGMARFVGTGFAGFMVADTSGNTGSDESGFLLKTAGTLIGQFGVRQSDQSVYIKNRVYGTVERVTITSAGNVGLATSAPTKLLDVNSDGIRVRNAMTPASSSAACNQGDISWDTNYVYVCVAANSWKRASLTSW